MDSIESGEKKGEYVVQNEYEWTKAGGDKIIRHSAESYSLDEDSDKAEEERPRSEECEQLELVFGETFKEHNIQNNLEDKADDSAGRQTENHLQNNST